MPVNPTGMATEEVAVVTAMMSTAMVTAAMMATAVVTAAVVATTVVTAAVTAAVTATMTTAVATPCQCRCIGCGHHQTGYADDGEAID